MYCGLMVIQYQKISKDILPASSRKVIKKMEKLAWKFHIESWVDRHKNDIYYMLVVKSPNMKITTTIQEQYFNEITEKFLLEREAQAVSIDWVERIFDNKFAIQNPISVELEKYLLKNKSNVFLPIYEDALEFDVKISPTNKNKPKKVKVTIEIL